MTEMELVRAAAAGDQDAFARLVQQYENKVYRLALRLCGSEEDAADVAQESFLSAWRGLPNFRGEAGFATWLYRLTNNAAIDHLRKVKKQRGDVSLDDDEAGFDAPDSGPTPQQAAEGRELQQAVAAGLRQLSEDHRSVLVLREVQLLSYEEIARVLQLDLGTVKSRISRARNSLRKILTENGNLSGYLPSNPSERPEKKGGR